MNRFLKLMVLLSIVSVLSGCTPVTGEPTTTPTAAPATPVPVQASSTPPKVIVISPTPGTLQPTLEAVPGPAFCADEQVQAAIEALSAALKTQDGAA